MPRALHSASSGFQDIALARSEHDREARMARVSILDPSSAGLGLALLHAVCWSFTTPGPGHLRSSSWEFSGTTVTSSCGDSTTPRPLVYGP